MIEIAPEKSFMLNTKLILIEGLPGAGKSTSTVHLGTVLQQHGIACRFYQEEDDPHPIPCLDFEIKALPQSTVPLWRNFVNQAVPESIITIIESRLWQNTALFMYMSEIEVEDILKFQQQVCQVLTPLSPVLLYLEQENTDNALRQMVTARGNQWMEDTLSETIQYPWFKSRGFTNFTGWVQFFEEWHYIAERLYNDWPSNKKKIVNPHENWVEAYEQMYTFLQIEGDNLEAG
jgi:hypothetical protein